MTRYRKSVFPNERMGKHFHAKNQLKKLVITMTAQDISSKEKNPSVWDQYTEETTGKAKAVLEEQLAKKE